MGRKRIDLPLSSPGRSRICSSCAATTESRSSAAERCVTKPQVTARDLRYPFDDRYGDLHQPSKGGHPVTKDRIRNVEISIAVRKAVGAYEMRYNTSKKDEGWRGYTKARPSLKMEPSRPAVE